jgi:hypothetical protein
MTSQGTSLSTFSRSISAQGDSLALQKIAVFPQSSFVAKKVAQDLEDYAFCNLDACVSTATIFSQDDCLHMEFPPLPSLTPDMSCISRARYNFQQGLLNMKEVMEPRAS